jgi:hypothetical protein
MKKRKVEVTVEQHGRNWINHERPPYCPECDSKDIKHSTTISQGRNRKMYSAKCLCLVCGCEFILVRTEEENDNEADK